MRIILNGNRTFDVVDLTQDQRDFLLRVYSYDIPVKKYDWKAKKWIFHAEHKHIEVPATVNISTLRFKMGYIFSVCNIMYPQMDRNQVNQIVSVFKNTDLVINNYYNLEDKNNAYDNLNTLLKYKYGILQTPTGSGKTEIIATLVRNILDRNEKVLVISETTPVLDELRSRLRGQGVIVPNYFDKDSLINIIKPTGFCRNGIYNNDAKKDFFNQVKYLLADEVETTVTPTFVNKIMKDLIICDYFYGFSATAIKELSKDIPKNAQIKEVLTEHSDGVISYYGFTAVDTLPRGFNITINLARLDIKLHPDIQERNLIIRKVFNDQNFRNYIYHILTKGEVLFIPVNSKDALYSLIEDPNLFNYKIIMISGNGYELFYQRVKTKLKYDDVKSKVENKEINIILGTSSCFRGIDFHGIYSILLTFESQSSIVKQCIGRLTRQDTFNIYLVHGLKEQKIPFLNSAYYDIMDEIKTYYRLCNLKFRNEKW